MNTAGKLAAFAVVLGGALGGGAALGSVVGPIDVETDMATDAGQGPHGGHEASADPEGTGRTGAEGGGTTDEGLPGGVLVSQDGYTLEPERTTLRGTAGELFRFRIVGPDGTTVEDDDRSDEGRLHLVVVGRDLRAYAHLHPDRGPDDIWSVRLPALGPGAYRAYADLTVAGGPELTLGVDLTVPGPGQPAPLPLGASTSATVGGYDVALDGTPAAGTASELTLTVTRAGAPVTDLAPYLGAAGHLVAIRAADMAYLHVHPLDEVDGPHGPDVRFAAELPSPGDYRLFFDFAHAGAVHTAAFTVRVPMTGPAPTDGVDAPATTGTSGTTGTTGPRAGHSGHDTVRQEEP